RSRQHLVGDADALLRARVRVERSIEREGVTLIEKDLSIDEALDADLGTLQVAEHGDPLADLIGDLPHHLHALCVKLRLTMREVDPHHISARANQLRELFEIVRCGAQRCQNFCSAKHSKRPAVKVDGPPARTNGSECVFERADSAGQCNRIVETCEHSSCVVARESPPRSQLAVKFAATSLVPRAPQRPVASCLPGTPRKRHHRSGYRKYLRPP